MPRPGVPKKWTRSRTVLEPHMLVVLDPPSKANSSKFKSGTVVGTCQMTSVKCVDERTKVKVSDMIVQVWPITQVFSVSFFVKNH